MFGTKKKETEEVVKAADPAGQAAANAAQAAQRAAERADAAAQHAAATAEEAERREFEAYKKEKKLEELHRLIGMIDHTLLRQTATKDEIKKLCAEAVEYGFCAVCVQPVYVSACYSYLKKAPDVKIACVVGFPMGENKTETKVFETKRAVLDGANEIDMVICLSAVKNGNYGYVKREVKKVVKAAKGRPVKAILETSMLTRDEMLKAAAAARDAGAAFLKTSTGYFGGGATVEDVQALKQVAGGACSVKASGGVRTAQQLRALADAGAERIGTSSGTSIADELKKQM